MKKALMIGAVLGLVLGMSGVASAATGPKLILDNGLSSGCGSAPEIGWVQGNDSPLDANSSALSIRTDPGECAFAYNDKYGLVGGESIGAVKNLSFDFLTAPNGFVVVDSPVFSVLIDKNGDGLYDDALTLAAFYCPAPIGGDWARADFTGRTAVGCDIWLNSNGTTPVASSDGTHSAWANLVAAHPTWKLATDVGTPVYLAVYEPSAPGRALVDRIAIQNKMQQARGNVKTCKNEAAC